MLLVATLVWILSYFSQTLIETYESTIARFQHQGIHLVNTTLMSETCNKSNTENKSPK